MRRHGTQMTRVKSGVARVIGIVVIGIAAVAIGLPGCGVKSAPIPPEYARPERILDLRAQPDPTGIKLTWSRPTRYVGGHSMRDLSGFVIKRADGDGPMTALVNIPVTDQERFQLEEDFNYLDGETKMGNRYRYSVIAEAAGYHSDPSNEVEFTRVKPPAAPNPENFKLPTPSPLPSGAP
jgi:hypothetical protein